MTAVPRLRPCTNQVMFIVAAGAVGVAVGVSEADVVVKGASVYVAEPDAEPVEA